MAKTISFVKGKGSLRHNNREFIANNIDEARVPWNTVYIQKPLQEAYEEIFGNAVSEYNAKQKRSDRKIDDYLTKIKNSGNNEKQFYETVVQIGKRDDTGVLDENGNLSEAAKVARDILDEYARTFQERNPNLILFNAVLHMDEATPHLHLDYIPVAHGYKTGLSTRNSLTKGLQEMGIAPAVSKSDTETMHWQERERAYISELCKEHEIEIEVLGVDRDSYSIPEYKKAMREKEAAEAEIEILNAEKTEVEAVIENMNHDLESGQKDIEEQKEILKEITDQISDAEKKVVAKEKALDKILDAGKPVEKEIEEIKSQVSDVMSLFGGEPMVKLPKKTFEKMISRYRVAGTFENLNRQYASAIEAKDKTIAGLKEQISSLKSKVREFTDFVSEHGLMEVFREFIRPKSMKEKLEIGKQKSREMESQKRNLTVTVVCSHAYLDENGNYCNFTVSVHKDTLNEKLRKEAEENAKKQIEKTRESLKKKAEELEQKIEEKEQEPSVEEMIDKKLADSEDGSIYLDDKEMQQVILKAKEENAKKEAGTYLDVQV